MPFIAEKISNYICERERLRVRFHYKIRVLCCIYNYTRIVELCMIYYLIIIDCSLQKLQAIAVTYSPLQSLSRRQMQSKQTAAVKSDRCRRKSDRCRKRQMQEKFRQYAGKSDTMPENQTDAVADVVDYNRLYLPRLELRLH